MAGSTKATSYKISGLSSSTTYYYKVSAYNSIGEGPMPSVYGSAMTKAMTLGPLTDIREGKTYKTVAIGGRNWMAENLNYGTSSCYNRADSNCVKYGKLYYIDSAKDACPFGWRLSTKDDWEDLIAAVGGKSVAGKKLKAKSGWDRSFYYGTKMDGNGTDDFGFSAMPGGYFSTGGSRLYLQAGSYGSWWASDSDGGSYTISMMSEDDSVSLFGEGMHYRSVRCVED